MCLEWPKSGLKVFRFAQSALILINIVMFIGGLVLFGISVWALSESRGFFSYGLYMTAASVLLLVSVILLFVSILGIIGAKNLVRPFIIVFIVFLSLLLILIAVMSTSALLFRDNLATAVRAQIYDSAREYFDNSFVQDSWDTLQRRFKCCGLVWPDNSSRRPYQVWETNSEFKKDNGPRVPESCCNTDMVALATTDYTQFRFKCQGSRQNIYLDDCYVKLKQFMRPRAEGIAFSGIILAAFAIVGILFAILLLKSMKLEFKHMMAARQSLSRSWTNSQNSSSSRSMGNTTATLHKSRRVAPSEAGNGHEAFFPWQQGAHVDKSYGRKIMVTDQHLVNQRAMDQGLRSVSDNLSNRAVRLQSHARMIHSRAPWQ